MVLVKGFDERGFVFFTNYASRKGRELAGMTVANLFFEPSTRTRASFELASRRLGAHVLNLDMHSSSRAKGETLLDTIYTLESMNTDIFVIRDSGAGIPEFLLDHVAPHVSVISAGEAHLSHPTQGLLDVLTIRAHKRRFAGLKVAIVGDIKHSRVARSAATALSTLGTTDIRHCCRRKMNFAAHSALHASKTVLQLPMW